MAIFEASELGLYFLFRPVPILRVIFFQWVSETGLNNFPLIFVINTTQILSVDCVVILCP